MVRRVAAPALVARRGELTRVGVIGIDVMPPPLAVPRLYVGFTHCISKRIPEDRTQDKPYTGSIWLGMGDRRARVQHSGSAGQKNSGRVQNDLPLLLIVRDQSWRG